MERNVYSGTLEKKPSRRELAHGRLARKAATEGIVLLKNENLLPFQEGISIALLGNGANKTVKGGIGSGDVNNRKNISIYQGLKAAGVAITSKDWILDYDNRYDDARQIWKEKVLEEAKTVENPFDAYAENPFFMPDGRKVERKDIDGAYAAVYVISRISGEGKDRRLVEGDYYLSKREQEDILYLNQENIPIVLILNSGGSVELTGILEQAENIKAVLNISQLGQEGGHAVADILLGRKTPEGKLTSTWAKHYEDYPFSENYSHLNGNLSVEEYKEGIYVGYRYFDSFEVEALFPFGYGLSYTDFEIKFTELRVTEDGIEVSVFVKNIGKSYSGREVIQVYLTLPQKGNEKEYHRLAGFAKTDILQPKEVQELKIPIEQKQFASFASQLHAWLIESGSYGIWIGNHAASLELCALVRVAKSGIIEQNKEICPKKTAFSELGVSDAAKKKEKEWLTLAQQKNIPVFEVLSQEEASKVAKENLEREIPVEELIPLLFGNITQGASTLGSAGIRVPGSAGETTECLEEKYKKRSLIMADGPAGLRLRQSYEVDKKTNTIYGLGVLGSLENGFLEEIVLHENADTYYQYCTAFPVGTALAQTWDIKLMKAFGKAIAKEMEEFHVDLWLAPGMNIQRNPLCGRNFEYYSEDPLLSGVMAAAVTQGVQSNPRCGVTIKHFACNNQEDNRMGVDCCLSERALREIYLRGFEIAVKRSAPIALMSSYNLINGVHAANNKDICTTVARKEWGFEGVIMSDWNTTVPLDGSIPWKCIDAGNDIIMPGNINDEKNIREAYEKGLLKEETIRKSARRVLRMVERLS